MTHSGKFSLWVSVARNMDGGIRSMTRYVDAGFHGVCSVAG